MPKTSKPDQENPEWTEERMRKAMRFSDLSPEMQKVLAPNKQTESATAKKSVSIQVSSDVYAALKASGLGWQARVDQVLRKEFLPGTKKIA